MPFTPGTQPLTSMARRYLAGGLSPTASRVMEVNCASIVLEFKGIALYVVVVLLQCHVRDC